MSSSEDPWSELEPSVAPPQANGELVFEAPWQGRAFGMAHSLVAAGRFSWDEFREQLIAALDGGAVGSDLYYERFLLALERTLSAKSAEPAQNIGADGALLQELDKRTAEFQARPHGHDH